MKSLLRYFPVLRTTATSLAARTFTLRPAFSPLNQAFLSISPKPQASRFTIPVRIHRRFAIVRRPSILLATLQLARSDSPRRPRSGSPPAGRQQHPPASESSRGPPLLMPPRGPSRRTPRTRSTSTGRTGKPARPGPARPGPAALVSPGRTGSSRDAAWAQRTRPLARQGRNQTAKSGAAAANGPAGGATAPPPRAGRPRSKARQAQSAVPASCEGGSLAP